MAVTHDTHSGNRKIIGSSVDRVDARAKVTGSAAYAEDLMPEKYLTAMVLHSTVAHANVVKIDISKALEVKGVVDIVTCFDVPDLPFPTAGHPWSTEKKHQDIADRLLLNRHVRFYGDDIAAVVAENDIACKHALKLIEVEYEELPHVFDAQEAAQDGAPLIHPERTDTNVLVHSSYDVGDYDEAIKEPGLVKIERNYQTPIVQHCHIEGVNSFAYEEQGKMVCVSSTQIPHIVRRVCSQATGLPMGDIRIIKPYIGGGFGNKQDVLTEPLNIFLSKRLGGRCVKLFYTREEVFVSTRVRHAMNFRLTSWVRKDGTFAARKVLVYSNQGAYASHAHALAANAVNAYRMMYPYSAIHGDAYTVYTNLPTAGAMRAYGIPQIGFALESHIDDICDEMGFDRIEFRLKNMMKIGYRDPQTTITCHSTGLAECIRKGSEFSDFLRKQKTYGKGQTGPVRRGIGMGIFCYKTGVYPISLETSACRMVLNQDGSIQLQMGATEIGQGADTVFAQMAAEELGFSFNRVHILSTQDTDVTPFDTGAYASRQTYVSGMAVKKTARKMKSEILAYASTMIHKDPGDLDIEDDMVVHVGSREPLIAVSEVAMEACYSLTNSKHIAAEETHHCTDNTYSFGVCFAEVEVDIPMAQIQVLNIVNVHDSGTIINTKTASGQVHGGMSMGLGYALSERIIIDEKTGRVLNNNLLDYKLMTSMDTPELHDLFVETDDPTGPFGNKSLGEPPVIPVAPAIRNAVKNATGVAIDANPLYPERLFHAFKEAGLIGE